jgi:hypothetical protein
MNQDITIALTVFFFSSSYLSASVAEKTTNRVVNNGIYNYDF